MPCLHCFPWGTSPFTISQWRIHLLTQNQGFHLLDVFFLIHKPSKPGNIEGTGFNFLFQMVLVSFYSAESYWSKTVFLFTAIRVSEISSLVCAVEVSTSMPTLLGMDGNCGKWRSLGCMVSLSLKPGFFAVVQPCVLLKLFLSCVKVLE